MAARRPPTTSRGGPEAAEAAGAEPDDEASSACAVSTDCATETPPSTSRRVHPSRRPRRRARTDHQAHHSRPRATSTNGAPTSRTRSRSAVPGPERKRDVDPQGDGYRRTGPTTRRAARRPAVRQRPVGRSGAASGANGGGRHPGPGRGAHPSVGGVHLAAQDLAGRALGQLGHDPHRAGVLVGGDPLLGELDDVLGRRGGALAQRDGGADLLAHQLVRASRRPRPRRRRGGCR